VRRTSRLTPPLGTIQSQPRSCLWRESADGPGGAAAAAGNGLRRAGPWLLHAYVKHIANQQQPLTDPTDRPTNSQPPRSNPAGRRRPVPSVPGPDRKAQPAAPHRRQRRRRGRQWRRRGRRRREGGAKARGGLPRVWIETDAAVEGGARRAEDALQRVRHALPAVAGQMHPGGGRLESGAHRSAHARETQSNRTWCTPNRYK
jgi:hypothetical protein